ncbi:hypothetical protein KQI86_19145 [Clostridium sp. MSJ-11]|uniref:Uncharacterized protein n=1 Tax=Clostridium mobile TaxID=2841512 RepID=A0ABS6EMF5_9CLOT|nr:hypothetical protein [Clostridium mobile]MBU5486420.1 hypothetical protein [Clostridium mobile]
MKKIITESPNDMTESMHNMVFVKNKEVYLRGIGEDYTDISLEDYCKNEYKRLYDEDIDANVTEFGEYMDDDSLLSLFYWACVGFAEVREHLKIYEDEAKKIRMSCTKLCHMGKDIKLIEREYREGHEPYGQILAEYECQLRDCPKMCSRYKALK